MLFKVDGARSSDGGEVSISIDAPNKSAAQAAAKSRGIMVSSVMLDSEAEGERIKSAAVVATIAPPPAPGSAPEYADVVKSAATVRAFAGFFIFVGVVALLAGVGGAIAMIARAGNPESMGPAIGLLLNGLVGGALCLGVAALLKLLASSAGCLRDLARNSFEESA